MPLLLTSRGNWTAPSKEKHNKDYEKHRPAMASTIVQLATGMFTKANKEQLLKAARFLFTHEATAGIGGLNVKCASVKRNTSLAPVDAGPVTKRRRGAAGVAAAADHHAADAAAGGLSTKAAAASPLQPDADPLRRTLDSTPRGLFPTSML